MKKIRMMWNSLDQAMRNKIISVLGVSAMVAFCLFSAVAWPKISGKPVMSLVGENELTIAAGSEYKDEGATATLLGKSVADRMYKTGEVDITKPGTYEVKYNVDGRWQTYSVSRTIHVADQEAPVIQLNGEERISVNQIEDYQDPGAVATDNCDGDLTEQISRQMDQVNDYTFQITYKVNDQAGNEGVATRKVVLYDPTPPEITLNGDAKISIKEREKFKDPGASARDERDGDLSENIVAAGYVDIYRPGDYTVTYTVVDADGNQAQVNRTVTVERVHKNPESSIYLTFDDGPSPDVTARILDVLAANNIKATFFIVNYSESNRSLIQRMVDEGHTIGIHGYSHDYSKIYSTAEAFMENVHTLKDKLKTDVGYDAFCMRFPGGSGNTVSKEYASGIMSELVQLVTDDDLMYVDWNVSSGDAERNNRPAGELVSNTTGGLKPGRTNIVLMHDTSAKQTTADALQRIIDYGLANGYGFYPITEDTVPIHQNVLN